MGHDIWSAASEHYLTIRLGIGRNAEGAQNRFDNVDLLFEAAQ